MHSHVFLVSWRDLDAIWFLTKFLFAEKCGVQRLKHVLEGVNDRPSFLPCLGLRLRQVVSTGRGWPTSGDTFGWPGWANSRSVFFSDNGLIKMVFAKLNVSLVSSTACCANIRNGKNSWTLIPKLHVTWLPLSVANWVGECETFSLVLHLDISCSKVFGHLLRQIRNDRCLDNCRLNIFDQWHNVVYRNPRCSLFFLRFDSYHIWKKWFNKLLITTYNVRNSHLRMQHPLRTLLCWWGQHAMAEKKLGIFLRTMLNQCEFITTQLSCMRYVCICVRM